MMMFHASDAYWKCKVLINNFLEDKNKAKVHKKLKEAPPYAKTAGSLVTFSSLGIDNKFVTYLFLHIHIPARWLTGNHAL